MGKYGVSARAGAGWSSITSYFERASNTPTGQRIRAFYDQGQKQVMDVHNEARHLADLKSGKSADHARQASAPAPAARRPLNVQQKARVCPFGDDDVFRKAFYDTSSVA